jgi:beta-carotene 3-hydroxylase
MEILHRALIVVVAFAAMELFSYLVHRFIYHGLLWALHRSHHTPRKGAFELNDLFPTLFAAITIFLIMRGVNASDGGDLLAASSGITAYGIVYFFVHDLYVHRRVKALRLRIPFLVKVKKAHALHHRYGGEPYGLLMFFDLRRVEKETVAEEEAV